MKKQILNAILEELTKDAKAYQSDLQTLDTGINLDEDNPIEVDDISQKDQSTDISNDLQGQALSLDSTIGIVKEYQTISCNEFSPGGTGRNQRHVFAGWRVASSFAGKQ